MRGDRQLKKVAEQEGRRHTEERGVSGHIGTLQHLRKPSECAHDTFDDVERRLSALTEAVRETIRVIGIIAAHPSSHAAHSVSSHATHATHPVTTHAAHSIPAHAPAHAPAVHRGAVSAHAPAHAGVW